jgi:hypothetical protein
VRLFFVLHFTSSSSLEKGNNRLYSCMKEGGTKYKARSLPNHLPKLSGGCRSGGALCAGLAPRLHLHNPCARPPVVRHKPSNLEVPLLKPAAMSLKTLAGPREGDLPATYSP